MWFQVKPTCCVAYICDLNFPPISAFPNFSLDAPSSVIYNLYGYSDVHEAVRWTEMEMMRPTINEVSDCLRKKNLDRRHVLVLKYSIFEVLYHANFNAKKYVAVFHINKTRTYSRKFLKLIQRVNICCISIGSHDKDEFSC